MNRLPWLFAFLLGLPATAAAQDKLPKPILTGLRKPESVPVGLDRRTCITEIESPLHGEIPHRLCKRNDRHGRSAPKKTAWIQQFRDTAQPGLLTKPALGGYHCQQHKGTVSCGECRNPMTILGLNTHAFQPRR